MPNGFSLLRTGQGNTSPVYNPELSRFNGWARQLPTLVRLPSRGRALDHPAHTPAQPLAGRTIPEFAFHQVPPFPQQITMEIFAPSGATAYYNTHRLPTPCILTKLFAWWLADAIEPWIQVGISPNLVTSDAQFHASALIFKSQPYRNEPMEPIADDASTLVRQQLNFDLNIPIPAPPKNILTIRIHNTGSENIVGFFAFHCQPL